MKKNVDLTENMIFSRVDKVLNVNNIFTHDDDDMDNDPINEIVFTGNKKTRQYKKEWCSFISGKQCECCGRISRTPWDMDGTLCKWCSRELEKEYKNKKGYLLF